MAVARRVILVLVAVAVGVAGIGLGAQSQREDYAANTSLQLEINQRGSAGDVIAITALLAVAGMVGAVVVLCPASANRTAGQRAMRVAHIVVLASCLYVLVNLVQTAFPWIQRLDVGDAIGASALAVNLLASNADAVPSALIAVFGLFVAAIKGCAWACAALWGRPSPQRTPLAGLLSRQLGMLLVALPFLAIGFWGSLRILVDLPSGPDAAVYQAILPLCALSCLGLAASTALKAWQVVRVQRESHLAPIALDLWQGIGRAEAGLVGVLAAAALVAAFLKPVSMEELVAGRTFGADLRRHIQLLLFVLAPLAPLLVIHRQGLRVLASRLAHEAAPPSPTRLTLLAACTALSLAAAGFATWSLQGALWAWALGSLALLPAAIALQRRVATAGITLVAAFACWAVGNTLTARYVPSEIGTLQFPAEAGLGGLWQVAGVVLVGLAATRLARPAGLRLRANIAIPLATGTAICLAALAWLELPLKIWTDSDARGQSVAVGTVLSAQDQPVQIVMHVVALMLCLAAAAMTTRLLHPEWFARGRDPQSMAASEASAVTP